MLPSIFQSKNVTLITQTFLKFIFLYSVLISSWKASISIFFILFDIASNQSSRHLLTGFSPFFLTIFSGLFIHSQPLYNKVSNHKTSLEDCARIIQYFLCCTALCGTIIGYFILKIHFTPLLFLLLSFIILTFLLTSSFLSLCKNFNKRLIFILAFLTITILFNSLDTLAPFLRDNTEISYHALRKTSRGWGILSNFSLVGNVISITIIALSLLWTQIKKKEINKLQN